MTWKLWLDDQAYEVEGRKAPDKTWVVATSSEEALAHIDKLGAPYYISFDFDLGIDAKGKKDTAERVYKYLFEKFPDADIDYDIHSENIAGQPLIQSYMDSWKKSKSLP